jgi:L-alanine-DL-glutamate epimerase-like enolase superfamily enzyme
MACWDLRGKAENKSVCALLGGLRDRAPTYASGALMRQHPVDYLAEAGPRLVGMGFRQMKMQCGSEATVSRSVERVRVMRESIGPDIDLMCDINQLWSVPQAVVIGRRSSRITSGWRTRRRTTTSSDWRASPMRW